MTKQNYKKQAIGLTRKQFKALLKVVYLGNWVANAYRTEDMQKEYERIEDYIFSLAPQFGMGEYMDHEESDGDKYYPTNFFEETTDVHKLHEEYDEETMWDELAERLGKRDFFKKYSKEEIQNMSREEHFIKLSECIDVWNEEFSTYGLDRFRIKNENLSLPHPTRV
ncbi:hypothetical protein COY29_01860 [Candidatus Woesebacteria bacterium CG_4_10_14_0_2_um_filter_39_14]|uniref:Uncharacterized protein n=1 Tax=Candidatus Woesebacteria bacterium CG_4_10_14_0_2_um_filter_39_14 TaxID=1975054 RepID=A0A2M7TP88_9BACT|nr:MAG: hypothetical protein COY29_01860 [Candidatus Woesebacteria bacterium CG_4_10_14_0_2_um_filter_39_14]